MKSEILNKLLYALFPRRCAFCGEIVEFDKELCSDCYELNNIETPLCLYCGKSKADCKCKKHKMQYKGIVAPYYYTDKVIVAIHNLKFNGFRELSYKMGSDIARVVKENYSEIDFDFVTFVPMKKYHKNIRGYNQAELIAKSVAINLNLTCVNSLNKNKITKTQRKQTSQDRKANVYGAFEIKNNIDVNDKIILLIDDVKTTGSTLNECSRALMLSDAKAVYCATVALTK